VGTYRRTFVVPETHVGVRFGFAEASRQAVGTRLETHERPESGASRREETREPPADDGGRG
jgi:hypothetical protein